MDFELLHHNEHLSCWNEMWGESRTWGYFQSPGNNKKKSWNLWDPKVGRINPTEQVWMETGKIKTLYFILIYPKNSACLHTPMYWSQDYVALGATVFMRDFRCSCLLSPILPPWQVLDNSVEWMNSTMGKHLTIIIYQHMSLGDEKAW